MRHATSGVDIDITLGELQFERAAVAQCENLRIGGSAAREGLWLENIEHVAKHGFEGELRYKPRRVFKRERVACNVARGTVPSFSELRALQSMVRK